MTKLSDYKNETLKIRTKSLYTSFNNTEKKISSYLNDNFDLIPTHTISSLAKELNLANSTVYQFIRKLGYNGFRDFQLSTSTEQIKDHNNIFENLDLNCSPKNIALQVFSSSIDTINMTAKYINYDDLALASEIMYNSKLVHFFGLGGSLAVAMDCYHKFMRTPLRCNFSFDYHMQVMNATLLDENSVAFIITHTGSNKEAKHIAEIALKKRAKIIVLTSYPNSPITKLADVTLLTNSKETLYRSESLTSRIGQLTIIDSLYVITMFKNEEASNASLKCIREAISSIK